MFKFYLLFTYSFFSFCLQAQYGVNWSRNYGGASDDDGSSITVTNDGGYIAAGLSYGRIMRLDNNGSVVWDKHIGNPKYKKVKKILRTSDNNFILVGYIQDYFGGTYLSYGENLWIVKINGDGDVLWEQFYNLAYEYFGYDIIETNSGDFVIAGAKTNYIQYQITQSPERDFYIVKVDSLGNKIWEKSYGNYGTEYANSICFTSDGGYLLVGNIAPYDTLQNNTYGQSDVKIIKTDSLGDLLWEKKYGGSGEDLATSVISVENGFIVAGFSSSSDGDLSLNNGQRDAWVFKIDFNGNKIWEKSFGKHADEFANSIIKVTNNEFVFAGRTRSTFVGTIYGDTDGWIVSIDSLGNLISENTFGGSHFDNLLDFKKINNNELIAFGSSSSDDGNLSLNNGGDDYWVLKLNRTYAEIKGEVIIDYSENCFKDTLDLSVPNVIVKTKDLSTNSLKYFTSSETGRFNFNVDSAFQELTIETDLNYYTMAFCSNDTQYANLSSVNTLDTINFFLTPTISCPYMEVDISAPLLRRCFASNYNISYCNNGTIEAQNAFVEVEFDNSLTVNSSSIPWSSFLGNTYSFPIGNVGVFECGNFYVNVTVSCDSATFIGQTLCSEAHIYPDTSCIPFDNTWSKAELETSAECFGTDSVLFTLKNIGTGNMTDNVVVNILDEAKLIKDTIKKLNIGQEIQWLLPISGIAQRIMVDQPENHPYKTITTDAVSICDKTSLNWPGPIQDNFTLAYPNDEEADFVAIDCQEVIGAYDPNDKTVFPSGVSKEHYISKNVDLKYKIRFQNTGNDTAFNVIITDSITDKLDLGSIQIGASSHPYTFKLKENRVAEFTFRNIMLPDSFINEPASHGFIQYKIAQNKNNKIGDEILNNADIFFDYNPAIRTNTAYNEIGNIILDTVIYLAPENPMSLNNILTVKTYPNPATEYIYFEIENNKEVDLSLELYNLSGKLLFKEVNLKSNKIKLKRSELSHGTYLFRVYSNAKEIIKGKVVFQ